MQFDGKKSSVIISIGFYLSFLFTTIAFLFVNSIFKGNFYVTESTIFYNFGVLYKLLLFLGLAASSFILFLTIKFSSLEWKINYWQMALYFIPLPLIIRKIYKGVVYADVKLDLYLGISLIILFYFFHSVFPIFKKYFLKIMVMFVLPIVTLVLVIFPIYPTGKVINFEGIVPNTFQVSNEYLNHFDGVNRKNIENVFRGIVEANFNQAPFTSVIYDFEVDFKVGEKLKKKVFEAFYLTDFLQSTSPKLTLLKDSKYQVSLRLDGVNSKNICFFIENKEEFISDKECRLFFNEQPKLDEVIYFIGKNVPLEFQGHLKNALDLETTRLATIKEQLNILGLRNASLFPLKSLRPNITKGIYFHHFQSFNYSLLSSTLSMSDFFKNQYGVGPGLVVIFIKKLLGTSLFDSTLWSILFANLIIVLFIIYISIKSKSELANYYLISGFCLSTLLIILRTEVIAPGLFSIRILPHLIFLLFAALNLIDSNKDKKSYNKSIFLNVCLYAISCFYNFEFGLMLTVAILLSGYPSKTVKFRLTTILIPIAIFAIKQITLINQTSSAIDLINYFLGVGFGGAYSTFDLLTLFISALFIFYIGIISVELYKKQNNNILFLGIYSAFTILKFFWNTSLNHFSTPVLCLSIFLFAVAKKDLKIDFTFGKFTLNSQLINNILHSVFVLIFFISLPVYKDFISNKNLGKDYQFDKQVSSLRKIDSQYIERIQDLIKLTGKLDHNCNNTNCFSKMESLPIISPQDSFYSLYFEKKILSPYQDISTSIITPNSIRITYEYIKNSKVDYVIIDKSLSQNEIDAAVFSNPYTEPCDTYSINAKRSRNPIEKLVSEIEIKYKKCGESDYFYALCK